MTLYPMNKPGRGAVIWWIPHKSGKNSIRRMNRQKAIMGKENTIFKKRFFQSRLLQAAVNIPGTV